MLKFASESCQPAGRAMGSTQIPDFAVLCAKAVAQLQAGFQDAG